MLIAILEAKAGAKIRHFFETTKSFGNFFQKTSKNLCSALSQVLSFLIAGAKVALSFYSPNIFAIIFKNYLDFLKIHKYTYIYIYNRGGYLVSNRP